MFNATLNVTRKEIPDWVFKLFGSYLSLASFLGIFANGTCLFIFSKYNHLRSPTSIFIIGLLSSDLGLSIFGSPLAATSTFATKLQWGVSECIFEGIVVYFFGLSSMYVLAAISHYRFILITKPLCSNSLDYSRPLLTVTLCFIFGLFWSLIPLSGWTRYEPEGLGTTCAVAYDSANLKVLSYNISIFFFCFLIPIIIMIYSYIQIFKMIRHMNKTAIWNKKSRIMKKKIKLESKITKTVVMMIGAFLVSWTPYAVVSFWKAFGLGQLSPIVSTLPAIIAKSAPVWNPFIYAFSCKEFRKVLFELIPCLHKLKLASTTNDTSPEAQEMVTAKTSDKKRVSKKRSEETFSQMVDEQL